METGYVIAQRVIYTTKKQKRETHGLDFGENQELRQFYGFNVEPTESCERHICAGVKAIINENFFKIDLTRGESVIQFIT